jgi:MFS family permease
MPRRIQPIELVNDDDVDQQQSSNDTTCCASFHKTRFIILLIGLLSLSSIRSNEMTFNFTVICMLRPDYNDSSTIIIDTNNATEINNDDGDHLIEELLLLVDDNNQTTSSSSSDNYYIDMSIRDRSMLFAAVAVGALIVVLPSTWMIHRFGEHFVFGAAGLCSAIATMIIPYAAHHGLIYFIAARVMQGIGLAACFPVMGSITAHWAPAQEHGNFISTLFSSTQIASMFTMPIAGTMCESSAGWPSVYYLHGIISLTLFIIWLIIYRDHPSDHRCVSSRELGKIMNSCNRKLEKHEQRRVPYKAILTSPAVWAVWIASIGNSTGAQLVLQYMPIYMNQVMGYPIAKTGFTAILPQICQFTIRTMAGPISDRCNILSEHIKIRIFNSIAMGGMAICLIILAYVPHDEPDIALVVFICSSSFLGLSPCGFLKSATLVSRRYSQFVMGNNQLFLCLTILCLPFIVGGLAPNNYEHEWRHVFFVVATVLLVANGVFCIFGSAKPADWAIDSWEGLDSIPTPTKQSTISSIVAFEEMK